MYTVSLPPPLAGIGKLPALAGWYFGISFRYYISTGQSVFFGIVYLGRTPPPLGASITIAGSFSFVISGRSMIWYDILIPTLTP